MNHYLGIDLGTSSVRAIVADEEGRTTALGSALYPLHSDRPGEAEQEPAEWWQAVVVAVRSALAAADGSRRPHGRRMRIDAIGLTGQMHGLVLLDAAGRPLRRAIAWPDQRSGEHAARLADAPGSDWLHLRAGMPPAAGIHGMSLAWVRTHEPEVYRQARWALLPKDYLQVLLTGVAVTDPSDASGSLLFDVSSGTWSGELADALGVDLDLLPAIAPSASVAGALLPGAAAELGLPEGIPVSVGASDQATAAVSLQLEAEGRIGIGISSGGTVLVPSAAPLVTVGGGVHTMRSADGQWLRMGAILSAGLALDWIARILDPRSTTTLDELVAEADDSPAGAQGLLFVPYLRGERTPVFSASASATFRGARVEHGRSHLVRSVLEGVAFAIKDSLVATVGNEVGRLPLIGFGGGLRNPRWRAIVADVLEVPVSMTRQSEHSAFGAAMLAARSIGHELPAAATDPALRAEPNPAHGTVYRERYDEYLAARTDSITERALIH